MFFGIKEEREKTAWGLRKAVTTSKAEGQVLKNKNSYQLDSYAVTSYNKSPETR